MVRVYSLLLLVMLIWGVNVSAIKTLVEAIDPLLLTGFRIMVAGIAVLLICKVMGIFRVPNKKEWLIIVYVSIFNVMLHHSFIALGLNLTTGINASLISGANPLITAVLSFLILKHRITWVQIVGFVVGFIGVTFTTIAGTGGIAGISLGDLFIFLAIIVQAFSFILISRLKPTLDPRMATGYMLITGSIVIFLTSQVLGSDISDIGGLIDWKLGSIFIFSAVISTAFGHMTYNYAIKKVGPAETTIFMNLNMLFAVIGSAIFLHEPITLNHSIGFVLILVGVFIGSGSLEYILLKRRKRNINNNSGGEIE